MRPSLFKNREHDPRISYRGASPSRLDTLTDSVFSIAITLLIFNLANPNSFSDLLTFTKTLPAFLISISFVLLVWKEHVSFSEVYTLQDTTLTVLNTLFIALVIFYVYPLRFLTLFLTGFLFDTSIGLSIAGNQVPDLMVYYGFVAFALYFLLYLFYRRAETLKTALALSPFELLYTSAQKKRMFIMFSVPLLSISLTIALRPHSFIWASVAGGVIYFLYTPLIIWWHAHFKSSSSRYPLELDATIDPES